MRHILLLFLLLIAIAVKADSTRHIELQDGSVITGIIVDFSNGTYTIKSSSLGMIKLDDGQIRAIRSESDTSAIQSPDSTMAHELTRLQKMMTGDEEIMNLILSLQNDPDVASILNDPAIMNQIAAGDTNALQANPKIQKLLENPTIQAIVEQVK